MIKIKNKKAQIGYGIEWIYKFAILVVVVGGVVTVVLLHYSQHFDIRDLEASILMSKIAACVAPNGILKEFSDASIKNCFPFDEKELYLNATLGNDNIPIGDDFLATLCKAMEQKVKVTEYPSCHHSSYMVLDKNEFKKLELFLVIKKIDKNL